MANKLLALLLKLSTDLADASAINKLNLSIIIRKLKFFHENS